MGQGLVQDLSRSETQVLAAIHVQGRCTRADVAAALDLSPAMAARLVSRLQEWGLVREAGRPSLTGTGRQPALLELVPHAAFVVGIDISVEALQLLVADLHGRSHASHQLPGTALDGLSGEEIIRQLAQWTRTLVAQAGLPLDRVAAVGLAVAGMIDGEQGICLLRSTTPGWEDFPLAGALASALGLPVVLDESTRAKSVAEMRSGMARGVRHFLYVEAGATIGASIVIDGRPLQGVAGLAGELGHVTVDPGGALCRCGNRGCLQPSASTPAILAQARHLLEEGVYSILAGHAAPVARRTDRPATGSYAALTLSDLAAAAAQGDKLALGLLVEAGERLGSAISMALNLLGLDLVVMGGSLIRCSPFVLDAAARVVQLRVLPILPRRRRLVASTLDAVAGAQGAALLAINWWLQHATGPSPARTGDKANIQAKEPLALAAGS
jgi:predicted NBD/HSP70 family sugar kinase